MKAFLSNSWPSSVMIIDYMPFVTGKIAKLAAAMAGGTHMSEIQIQVEGLNQFIRWTSQMTRFAKSYFETAMLVKSREPIIDDGSEIVVRGRRW